MENKIIDYKASAWRRTWLEPRKLRGGLVLASGFDEFLDEFQFKKIYSPQYKLSQRLRNRKLIEYGHKQAAYSVEMNARHSTNQNQVNQSIKS